MYERVFFDTCALYGEVVCDIILRMAEEKLFRPYWSEGVLRELEKNLLARVGAEKAHRRIAVMREFFPDALVEDYEFLMQEMTCDSKDRHVLAGAYKSPARVLVTFNTKDFPYESVEPLGVQVVTPDEFLCALIEIYSERVGEICYLALLAYRRYPQTPEALAFVLQKSGLERASQGIYKRVVAHYEGDKK